MEGFRLRTLQTLTFPGVSNVLESAEILGFSVDEIGFEDLIIPSGFHAGSKYDIVVVAIGDHAFELRAIHSVKFHANIDSIGAYAFSGCPFLTSPIEIPDKIETIKPCTFAHSPIGSVTIGKNVKKIESNAFTNCMLDTVYSLNPTPPEIDNSSFSGSQGDMVLYVPAGSLDAYKANSEWTQFFKDIREIETGGVNDVLTDSDAPVEVYNLSGMFVGNSIENLASGIYIVRQGANVRKIAVK